MTTNQNSASYYENILKFAHTVYKLKRMKRAGWVRKGIPDPEPIAGHMYGLAVLAMLIQDPTVDKNRCIKMGLVHDMAESIVGDITPHDPVSNEEKARMEQEAFLSLRDLVGTEQAQEMYDLFMEYEKAETKEAKLVKDLDKLDMLVQAHEYEKEHAIPLDEFFTSTVSKLRHPEVLGVADAIQKQRNPKNS